MNVCYDQTGRAIRLADRALASGGEGEVYELPVIPKSSSKSTAASADAQKREAKIAKWSGSAPAARSPAPASPGTPRGRWPRSSIRTAVSSASGMNRIAFSTNLGDLVRLTPPRRTFT